MGIPADDAIRDDAMPTVPDVLDVAANAAGGAWVALAPPAGAAADLRSYELLIEGASADYEVTWKTTPSVGDRGVTIQSETPLRTPRIASPNVGGGAAWPSFRAIGGSGFTLRMVFYRPLP